MKKLTIILFYGILFFSANIYAECYHYAKTILELKQTKSAFCISSVLLRDENNEVKHYESFTFYSDYEKKTIENGPLRYSSPAIGGSLLRYAAMEENNPVSIDMCVEFPELNYSCGGQNRITLTNKNTKVKQEYSIEKIKPSVWDK